MIEFHVEQELSDEGFSYSDVTFYTDSIIGSHAIPVGTYPTIYSILDAMNTELAGDVVLSLNSDGYVHGVGLPWLPYFFNSFGADISSSSDTLWNLLGFDSNKTYTPLVNHIATRRPVGLLWLPYLNKIGQEGREMITDQGVGIRGQVKQVVFANLPTQNIMYDFVTQDEKLGVELWYANAAEGHTITMYDTNGLVNSYVLTGKSINGLQSILVRNTLTKKLYSLNLTLRRV